MHSSMRGAAAAVLSILAATSTAAQSCPHALVGQVTDQAGQPVWAGLVGVTGDANRAPVKAAGRYQLCNVPAGPLSFTVTAIGMQTLVVAGTVKGDGADTLDFHMRRPPQCWLPPKLSVAQLDSAELRWKTSAIHSYDVTISESYFGPGAGSSRVRVRDDTILSVENTDLPGGKRLPSDPAHFAFLLPPRLFARLHMRLADSGWATSARFDGSLGHPTWISEEMNCVFDAGGTIKLEGLKPIKP